MIVVYTTGWLEPLVDRIARDQTTVVCPVIDVINDDSFAMRPSKPKEVQVGGFSWGLIVRSSKLITCCKTILVLGFNFYEQNILILAINLVM